MSGVITIDLAQYSDTDIDNAIRKFGIAPLRGKTVTGLRKKDPNKPFKKLVFAEDRQKRDFWHVLKFIKLVPK